MKLFSWASLQHEKMNSLDPQYVFFDWTKYYGIFRQRDPQVLLQQLEIKVPFGQEQFSGFFVIFVEYACLIYFNPKGVVTHFIAKIKNFLIWPYFHQMKSEVM